MLTKPLEFRIELVEIICFENHTHRPAHSCGAPN